MLKDWNSSIAVAWERTLDWSLRRGVVLEAFRLERVRG
jgi:hypothetical protein